MEYFIIKQDKDMRRCAHLESWVNTLKHTNPFRYLRLATTETRIMFVADDVYNEYPDFIQRPFPLIKKELKNMLSRYQPNIFFENMVLVEKELGKQQVYCRMVVPEINCASPKSERQYGKLKKIVLDRKKVGSQRIFQVEGDNRVIMRLDVVESILRRNPYGIEFERIEVDERE